MSGNGGVADRGRDGVPIAPPGVPGYIGMLRAFGSSGTPFGDGTYRPSRSYWAKATVAVPPTTNRKISARIA